MLGVRYRVGQHARWFVRPRARLAEDKADSKHITFQTSGASISPTVSAPSATSVTWCWDDGSQSSGANPGAKDFGAAAARTHRIYIVPDTALTNLTFTAQTVTAVRGHQDYSSLKVFSLSNNQLTGIFDCGANNPLTQVNVGNNSGLTQLVVWPAQFATATLIQAYQCAIEQFLVPVPAPNLTSVKFQGTANSLDQASVDSILAALVANGKTAGICQLEGGTNDAPSATGIANAATLTSRTWTGLGGGAVSYNASAHAVVLDVPAVNAPTVTQAGRHTLTYEAAGVITGVTAANTARLETDTAGLLLGVLLEPVRTNKALYSLSPDAWTIEGTTASLVVDPALVHPLYEGWGVFKIKDCAASVGNIRHRADVTGSISTVAGTSYCASVLAKADTRAWVVLWVPCAGASKFAFFNASTGVLGTKSPELTSGMRALAAGRYLCWVRWTETINTMGNFYLGMASADNTQTYTGNGTSGLWLGLAQWEEDSVAISEPSSRIITCIGSQVTRAADVLRLTSVASLTGPETVVWRERYLDGTRADFWTTGTGATASPFTAEGGNVYRWSRPVTRPTRLSLRLVNYVMQGAEGATYMAGWT